VRAFDDDPPLPVEPLAGGDQQLGEGRLGIEIGDSLEVVVREVREVDLVEDLAVGRRIGSRRVRLVAALVGVGKTAQRSGIAQRGRGRVDDAVAEAEVAGRVRIEVREEWAEKPEDEGDRRQDQQRDQVLALQPEPVVEPPAAAF
jgi:hypothetical protein